MTGRNDVTTMSTLSAAQVKGTAPYIWLGPRWGAWLEFGPGGSHAEFERLAERLCAEFGAEPAYALSNPAANGKEYLYLRFGTRELLLMRRDDQVGLGAFYQDVPLLERVGATFGARQRGWRWPLYNLWRRLAGLWRPVETGAAPDRNRG